MAEPVQLVSERHHTTDNRNGWRLYAYRLNEDQKKRLDALAGKLHEQRLALRGATDPRADVRALIAGDKFDRDKARTLVGDKVAAVNTKSPEVIAAFGDFFDSLSPAQQAKVRGFLERRRHGWWNRG